MTWLNTVVGPVLRDLATCWRRSCFERLVRCWGRSYFERQLDVGVGPVLTWLEAGIGLLRDLARCWDRSFERLG